VDRRAFLAGTLGLLAVPLGAGAQRSGQVPRIGYLGNGNPTTPGGAYLKAFRQGLRELGYIEGQTVTIEYRWAEGNADRLPALAAELVRLKVDVIVLSGTLAIRAAQQATSSIPIVVGVILIDPVDAGFVASLARPGGNITGLASQYEEIVTKQVQLLAETVPKLSRVVLFHHTPMPREVTARAVGAASQLGLKTRVVEVSEVAEFEGAFRTARDDGAQAVLVLPSPFFSAQRRVLIKVAANYRLPAFYEFKEYVQDGGLISYGPSLPDMWRRAASYVDRILKGANPGDLPIERPTNFELAVNLKTAKALGLTIPPSVLARADEIIQ
jgi:putative ABC transport system substrate-binding protein